jgi:hypothetical protein
MFPARHAKIKQRKDAGRLDTQRIQPTEDEAMR